MEKHYFLHPQGGDVVLSISDLSSSKFTHVHIYYINIIILYYIILYMQWVNSIPYPLTLI